MEGTLLSKKHRLL